jgi:uncharacterized protein
MSPEAEPVDGSRLCLACGLCCQGLLHDWAQINENEIEDARRLGLRTQVEQGEASFSLPCPCHRSGRCTIYQERLSPCREYRCKLLRGYLAGEVTLDAGLRRVEQVKQLIAAIRHRLGVPEEGASIWQQLRTAPSGNVAADGALQLESAALLVQCRKHFWNPAESRRPQTS